MINIYYKEAQPKASNPTDTGFDVTCTDLEVQEISGELVLIYHTNVAIFSPDENLDIQLRCRSSINGYNLSLTNAVGTIDKSYKSYIQFRFKLTGFAKGLHRTDRESFTVDDVDKGTITLTNHWGKKDTFKIYKLGDRIGQMIIGLAAKSKDIEWIQTFDMEEDRGGFGSSGS